MKQPDSNDENLLSEVLMLEEYFKVSKCCHVIRISQ